MADVEIFLTTDRLRLRRLTSADVDHLYQLDQDPAVMRLLTKGVPTAYEVIRDEFLPMILDTHTRSDRHGCWAAELRTTGEFLGWFSLALPGDTSGDQAELGYRLRRAAWGHGYAGEGARALVAKGFELGLRRIYAETMAINSASRRVMEKAGLRYVRTFHPHFDDPIPGTEHGEVEYAAERGLTRTGVLNSCT